MRYTLFFPHKKEIVVSNKSYLDSCEGSREDSCGVFSAVPCGYDGAPTASSSSSRLLYPNAFMRHTTCACSSADNNDGAQLFAVLELLVKYMSCSSKTSWYGDVCFSFPSSEKT